MERIDGAPADYFTEELKKDLKEMAEFEGIQSMQKYLFQAVVKQAADNGFRY